MAHFSQRMNAEVLQRFWVAIQQGVFITRPRDRLVRIVKWVGGGWPPAAGYDPVGAVISEVAACRFGSGKRSPYNVRPGESMRAIAARLGCSPSKISRELTRNRDRDGCYRATSAHAMAYHRASRPKPGKLPTNPLLRQRVEHDLARKYSPEQIVGRLRREFGDDPALRISVETIYQSLYVPSRGGLAQAMADAIDVALVLHL